MFILIPELPDNTLTTPEIGRYGSNFGGRGTVSPTEAPNTTRGTPDDTGGLSGPNNNPEQFSQLTNERQSMFGFGMGIHRADEGGGTGRTAGRADRGQPRPQSGQQGDDIEQILQAILAQLQQANGSQSQQQPQGGQQRGNRFTRIAGLFMAVIVSAIQMITQTQGTQTAGSGNQTAGRGQQPPNIPSIPPPDEDTSGAGGLENGSGNGSRNGFGSDLTPNTGGVGEGLQSPGTGALAGQRNVLPQEGPI